MAASSPESTDPDPKRLERAEQLALSAPRPALAGSVLVGTAGWTDGSLISSGRFYPRGPQTSESRLRHYAAHFPLVEVDATYYALLPRQTAERWMSWTPDGFRFDVKAFPVLTGHPIDVARLPADLRRACASIGYERRVYPDKLPNTLANELTARFLDFLEPLGRSGRLGSVLLQFPPWFTATLRNARRLETLRIAMPDLPLSVEFRHPSWFQGSRRQRLLDLLAAHRLSFVCIDEPLIQSDLLAVTNPELAVVRFHGRNRTGWLKPRASVQERFDYLYDPEELMLWVEPIRRLEGQARAVHAVFNNCVRNYAVLNAQGLAVLVAATHGRSNSNADPTDAC